MGKKQHFGKSGGHNCSRRQFFIFFYFSEKTRLDISCDAWQMIHMSCQDLFSLKNKKFLNVVCYKFCLVL